MKKNNLVKLWGIGFVVAIIATGVFYGLVVSKMSSNTGNGRMLVVAAKALKPGTVLQAADVRLVPWLGEQLPKGSHGSATDVIGSTVIEPIGPDEPLFDEHIANAEGVGGSGVPAGMRAVSVHISDSNGVLALLHSGQKVDIQVVTGRSDRGDVLARTAIEDLKVLSVAFQPELDSQGTSLPVVTLLAKPAEADVLPLADSGARVRLTLRNPLDDEARSRSPLTLPTVMRTSGEAGHSNTPAPTPAATPARTPVPTPAAVPPAGQR
jgi:Flp pilus assembly protein CpaB